jgi:uncharacterized protein (TIGR02466 family)
VANWGKLLPRIIIEAAGNTMKSEMLNLFATPLYRSSLERAFTAEELKFFQQELGAPVAAIANHSSRNKLVLDAAPMQALRATLQEHLDNYFRTVFDTSNDVRLQITQSWLTLTRRGESHHPHTHPNSIASGVLYINLAPNDGINFLRNDDLIWYELMRKNDNYYNASSYLINTEIGDIIIFPSNVKHAVKQVTENIERVSLSFNTFFEGELGRTEFANALRLSMK